MQVIIDSIKLSIPEYYTSGQAIDWLEAEILNEEYIKRLSRNVLRLQKENRTYKYIQTYIKNYRLGQSRTPDKPLTASQKLVAEMLDSLVC